MANFRGNFPADIQLDFGTRDVSVSISKIMELYLLHECSFRSSTIMKLRVKRKKNRVIFGKFMRKDGNRARMLWDSGEMKKR